MTLSIRRTNGGVRRQARIAVVLMCVVALTAVVGCKASPSREGTPRLGGTLRVGVDPPASLDPIKARSASETLIARLLFTSLTSLDAGTSSARPGVADRWYTTSDQMHWDFHLASGAHFSNGRAIQSSDVKYTLERIAKKGSTASQLMVGALAPIEGFGAFNGSGSVDGLSGLVTSAPDVIHIDLTRPEPDLPALLAHPAFGIVPREAVDSSTATFDEHPVGSGPFMVASQDAGVIHLVRAPDATTYLDGIDLVIGSDDVSFRSFQQGALDWSPVPRDSVHDAETSGSSSFVPYTAVLFYAFNMRDPVFADERFREAIVHAIDRHALVKSVYGDGVLSSDGPVPQGVPSFQPDVCGDRCAYDPAKARTLIRAAFPNGDIPSFALDFDDDPTQQAVAKAIQSDLSLVGVKTTLRPHAVNSYAQVTNSRTQQLFRLGWVSLEPRADAILRPLFTTGADTNVIGFTSAPVDDLLRRAQSTGDANARLSLERDAERQIMAQVPIIPLAQFETLSVVGPRVRGVELDANGTFDGGRVWLSK